MCIYSLWKKQKSQLVDAFISMSRVYYSDLYEQSILLRFLWAEYITQMDEERDMLSFLHFQNLRGVWKFKNECIATNIRQAEIQIDREWQCYACWDSSFILKSKHKGPDRGCICRNILSKSLKYPNMHEIPKYGDIALMIFISIQNYALKFNLLFPTTCNTCKNCSVPK